MGRGHTQHGRSILHSAYRIPLDDRICAEKRLSERAIKQLIASEDATGIGRGIRYRTSVGLKSYHELAIMSCLANNHLPFSVSS